MVLPQSKYIDTSPCNASNPIWVGFVINYFKSQKIYHINYKNNHSIIQIKLQLGLEKENIYIKKMKTFINKINSETVLLSKGKHTLCLYYSCISQGIKAGLQGQIQFRDPLIPNK